MEIKALGVAASLCDSMIEEAKFLPIPARETLAKLRAQLAERIDEVGAYLE